MHLWILSLTNLKSISIFTGCIEYLSFLSWNQICCSSLHFEFRVSFFDSFLWQFLQFLSTIGISLTPGEGGTHYVKVMGRLCDIDPRSRWYRQGPVRSLHLFQGTVKNIDFRPPFFKVPEENIDSRPPFGGILRKHDDIIKWRHFPRYWPFVREIHRQNVNFRTLFFAQTWLYTRGGALGQVSYGVCSSVVRTLTLF